MRLKFVQSGAVTGLALIFAAQAAFADITLVTAGTGPMGQMSTTTSIAGMKIREESEITGDITAQLGKGKITIIRITDLGKPSLVEIRSFENKIRLYDAPYFTRLTKPGGPESAFDFRFDPTGESKTVAGHSCETYKLSYETSVEDLLPQDSGPTGDMLQQMGIDSIKITGTACIAPSAPGWESYRDYYRKAGAFYEKITAPETPGMRAIAKMAEKGIVLEMNLTGELDGKDTANPDNHLVKMMSGFSTVSLITTSLSTDPVGAEAFQTPAGKTIERVE